MIISFEGLDGCGKSTQIKFISELLQSSGRKVRILREPGGNLISEKIRKILLDKANLSMAPSTELLLYIASRAQLVEEEIAPLLDKGYDIILDRFIDSTTAYQGYGRGIDLEIVRTLNMIATSNGKYFPDITIFLDLNTEASLSRVFTRGEEVNRMESADIDFFRRVRNGFIEISELEPGRMVRVDATGTEDQVLEKILKALKQRNIV